MLKGGSPRREKACEPCRNRKAKCGKSSFCLNVQCSGQGPALEELSTERMSQPPLPSSNTLVHPQLSREAELDAWNLAAPKPAIEISLQASREEHPREDEHNSGLFSLPGMTDEEVWERLWGDLGDGGDGLSFQSELAVGRGTESDVDEKTVLRG